ncbi:proton-dependent oligopeptide transporter, POT family [Flexibacter flexilis DSM 6793]|uniref:Proton-dependent oligopeptide transporter, POT family n=1 Tax=Flexibacter flexilis DSM 6793 TaxID=927664 RepID=A0A1I1DDF2_9BACT|nr:peptide MFS transporter [Flexibacter flexilis]SFB72844.1 proton-dependent oligopeptide transporter, POT family [Flexibacter flexilis DSM 6793]
MSTTTTTTTKQGHPPGLYLLFATEMWERFSYYGMRAIFVLYLTQALLLDKNVATDDYYGSYTGLVYLTPLIGGYVSDRYWGNRRSILVGGLIMALGQLLMFISASFYQNFSVSHNVMLLGLLALIVGNGFFKPNISTMVGQLYPEGDSRRDSAYTIFYMGINLGAFFSPIICGFLGDTGNPADFRWGFLAACAGMVVSIITFELLKNKYLITPEGGAIGGTPEKVAQIEDNTPKRSISENIGWAIGALVLAVAFFYGANIDLIGSFIFSLSIIAPLYIILDKSLNREEKERISVIYIAAFFVIAFWAAFEQAGTSLTFFADEQTDRVVFGKEIPASAFNSINAIFIVLLAPIISIIWVQLAKKGLEPASPAKQAFGLLFLSIGYLVIAFGVKDLNPNVKVSIMWLTSLYFLHTIGELCLSPISLSMVNKLAPPRFAALLMGVWFLSTAAANKLSGTLGALYPDEKLIAAGKIPSIFGFQITNLYEFFMVFVVFAGVASLCLFLLSFRMKKMMHGRG